MKLFQCVKCLVCKPERRMRPGNDVSLPPATSFCTNIYADQRLLNNASTSTRNNASDERTAIFVKMRWKKR